MCYSLDCSAVTRTFCTPVLDSGLVLVLVIVVTPTVWCYNWMRINDAAFQWHFKRRSQSGIKKGDDKYAILHKNEMVMVIA